MKDLLLRAPVVVRTSDMKISRRRLPGRLRQNNASKCVLHVQYHLLFVIQPIKSLICGVVVDNADVKS